MRPISGQARGGPQPGSHGPSYDGAVMQERARSFAFATRFLPRTMRPDVQALYQFCRTVDDLVDDRPQWFAAEQVREQLEEWQRWLDHSPVPPNGSSVTNGLAGVINKHRIPPRYLIDLVEGCKSDLSAPQFQEFVELRHYCYQVGSTVGLAMCPILKVADPQGLDCARDLGIAMQLTNVIRDVPEDMAMGRCYLPATELRSFDCPVDALPAGDLTGLIRFQCERAHVYYRAGIAGVASIHPAAQYAIRLAASLYEAILDKIAQQHYDVYACRASTTLHEKVWLAVRLRLGR